jgi:hypothetical protein
MARIAHAIYALRQLPMPVIRASAMSLGVVAAAIAAAPALAQPHAPAPAPAPPAPPAIVPDCARQAEPDIVVCGRRGERSPYRQPIQRDGFDPDGPMSSVSRERHRLYEVGDTGIGSCTNVGPGGWTGCQFLHWRDEHHQRDGNGPVAVRVGVGKRDLPHRSRAGE